MRARGFALIAAIGFGYGTASASPTSERAAIARLDAAYAPAGKLTGAARTQQACGDAAALQAAWRALPEQAPSTAAVDTVSWRGERDVLGRTLTRLVDACKAADHRVSTNLDNTQFETADQIVERVDRGVRGVVDAARPRALPAAVTRFKTAYTATKLDRRACAQHTKLARLVPGLAAAPAGGDAAQWSKTVAELQHALDEFGRFACSVPRGADEELAGALVALHDALFALVRLVPPRPLIGSPS